MINAEDFLNDDDAALGRPRWIDAIGTELVAVAGSQFEVRSHGWNPLALRKIGSRSPQPGTIQPRLRDPLTHCVAAAILSREVIELRLQLRCEAIVGSSERVGQLVGSARTENDGRNGRVRQNPSDCQFRQRFAFLASDLTKLANRHELALVPIPGMIRLPESAEFRRKATLLRRIAVLVFAAQKDPGKRIERIHRETFFLHQREKFSLNFTEQQVVTWLGRNETRQL